jgi:hypothetical protein
VARVVLLLALLLLALVPSPSSAAATLDRAVPGGWWYSQTGLPAELGFSIVDDPQARFWSEFKRLGGVDALGYPVSHRFQLDGFTVQATQRVVMQWRPDSSNVMFVNVFDRLHDLGHDGWLRSVRQTPPPTSFDENGKPWEQIVRDRIALMDGYPAIKAKYSAAIGDPIQANGLPTAGMADVGNHFSLRAQRVVFQQWKEDVPWAKKGEVTVALGGDIFKEIGLIPAEAGKPAPAPEGPVLVGSATPAPTPTRPGPTAAPVPVDTNLPTAPLSGPVERFLLTPADFGGSVARVVSEGPVDAGLLAQGRRDPIGYANRLTATGFVRGFRRTLSRDAAGKPLVAIAEVSLFRDPEAARTYGQLDGREGAADPQFRLEPLPAPGVGDESAAFRMVNGVVAGRGHLVLFRRANAVVFVSLIAQVASPTLEETVVLARAIDGRLR